MHVLWDIWRYCPGWVESMQSSLLLGELLQRWWRGEINKQTAGMPTLLCLSFLSILLRSLHVDLRSVIRRKNQIPELLTAVATFSSFFLHPFMSCSHTEDKWSHQARVRHKLLVVGARHKYGWHVLSEQLYCSAVCDTRWQPMVQLYREVTQVFWLSSEHLHNKIKRWICNNTAARVKHRYH